MATKPEFYPLLANNINVRTAHAKLEKQPRDPVWAAETEEAYRNKDFPRGFSKVP